MKNLLACYANCKYNSRCEELRTEILPIISQAASDINSYRHERGLSAIDIQTTKRGLKFIDVLSSPQKLPQSKRRITQSKRLVKGKPNARGRHEILVKQASPPTANSLVTMKASKDQPRIKKHPSLTKSKKSPARVKKLTDNKVLPFTPVAKASEGKVIEKLPEKSRLKIKKKRRRVNNRQSKLKMETPGKMPRRMKELEVATEKVHQENTLGGASTNQLSQGQSAEKPVVQGKRKSSKELAAKKKKKMFIILDGNNSALVDERGLMAKLLAGVSPNARYFEATEIELRLQVAYKK
jgi:hypothetical protein